MGESNKRRPGIRWDSVVHEVWKGTGGNQEDMISAGKVGRYKAEAEERTQK